MPKRDNPSGTFSDLYDAMQQKKASVHGAHDPPVIDPDHESIEVKKSTSLEVKKKRRATEANQPEQVATPVEDLPRNKVGYYFTQAEIDLIDEIQHEVKKSYRVKVSKNDIVRLAVAYLATDYHSRRDNSFLIEQLKNTSK